MKKGPSKEVIQDHEGEGDATTTAAEEESENYNTVSSEEEISENEATMTGPSHLADEAHDPIRMMVLRPRDRLQKPQREPTPVRRSPPRQRRRTTKKQLEKDDVEDERSHPANQMVTNEGIVSYLKTAFNDMTTQLVTAIQSAFRRGQNMQTNGKTSASVSTSISNTEREPRRVKRKPSQQSLIHRDSSTDSEESEISDCESASVRTSEIVGSGRPKKQHSSYTLARVPAFTGKEKWEVWINRFEAVSSLQKWNDDLKLQELLPRLQGTAGEFVFDQLPQKYLSNYSRLKKELSNRFGTYESKKNYRVQFNRRNQRLNETPEMYASELKRLYDKAYTNRDSRIRQEDLLQRFFMGLADEKARIHVELNREPCTIEEAVQDVLTYEETTNHYSSNETHRNSKKPVRQVKENNDSKQEPFRKTGKLNGRKQKNTDSREKTDTTNEDTTLTKKDFVRN